MNLMPWVKRETKLPSDSKLELKRRNENYDFLPRLSRAVLLFGFGSGTHNIRVERPFIVFLKQEAMTAVITIQKTGWN